MRKIYLLLSLFVCLCKLHATIYVIHFGTHYGHNYLPNAMIINLGDTVEFNGPLSLLPLQSNILPAGADSFSSDTENVYRYIPTVLGTHNYQCKADLEMIGSFYVQSNLAIVSPLENPFSFFYSADNQDLSILNTPEEPFEITLYNEYGAKMFCEKNIKNINLGRFGLQKAIYYLQFRKKEYIFTDKLFNY